MRRRQPQLGLDIHQPQLGLDIHSKQRMMGFLRASSMILKETVPIVRRFATDARKVSGPVVRRFSTNAKKIPENSGRTLKESGPVAGEVVNDVKKVSDDLDVGVLVGKIVTCAAFAAPFVYFSNE